MPRPLLSKHFGQPGRERIDAYLSTGGYQAATAALRDLTPDKVVDIVEAAGLRGRGGAGFPTARKWRLTPKREGEARYLVVNADESEPGTFKDRTLLEQDPHQLLEGILIAAYANQVHQAYIYLRGEFFLAYERLSRALTEATARGYFGKDVLGTGFDLAVVIHRGAGAYICGEETGLLESLEGRRGFPRLKPPYYPAVKGLYAQPTVLNNVETLCHLNHIITLGADGYKAYGPPVLYSVSGHVVHPGVKELPLGTSLREIIFEHAGGLRAAGQTWLDAGLERDHRHGRYDVHAGNYPADGRVLSRRVMRQMHPLQRGNDLAQPDPRQDSRRPGPRAGPGPSGWNRPEHDRHLLLPAGRERSAEPAGVLAILPRGVRASRRDGRVRCARIGGGGRLMPR